MAGAATGTVLKFLDIRETGTGLQTLKIVLF
jgi:hypothetical protein